MSSSSSNLFEDTAATEAALERVMAVLGGRLIEDPTQAETMPPRDTQIATR